MIVFFCAINPLISILAHMSSRARVGRVQLN